MICDVSKFGGMLYLTNAKCHLSGIGTIWYHFMLISRFLWRCSCRSLFRSLEMHHLRRWIRLQWKWNNHENSVNILSPSALEWNLNMMTSRCTSHLLFKLVPHNFNLVRHSVSGVYGISSKNLKMKKNNASRTISETQIIFKETVSFQIDGGGDGPAPRKKTWTKPWI